jgi:hypothetical protein
MGLFDKKYCDICGEKIGLLGNRKLEDGNLCKTCAKKLSPWFSDRRQSTVDQIKEQLAYREENEKKVETFHTTRTLGRSDVVCIDDDKGQFLVAKTDDILTENPDVLNLSQVTGCDMDVTEFRDELKQQNSAGEQVSFNPPRYCYRYDFYVIVRVEHPYFDEMRFRINDRTVEVYTQESQTLFGHDRGSAGHFDPNYKGYEAMAEEIKQALTQARDDTRQAAAAPKVAVTCPHCGATTMPDEHGCCEFCGGAIG